MVTPVPAVIEYTTFPAVRFPVPMSISAPLVLIPFSAVRRPLILVSGLMTSSPTVILAGRTDPGEGA